MKRSKHYVIYVPGIKDDVYKLQSILIQCWRLNGVRPIIFSMPWRGQGDYESKLMRLLDIVNQHHDKGHTVSLVGASAGASAVINAYCKQTDKIYSLAYICGKINHPETVYEKIYYENPAFKTSLLTLQTNLKHLSSSDKHKMQSFYSPADQTVPHPDTTIAGVKELKLPALSHTWSILYTLTFGSGMLIKALKKCF